MRRMLLAILGILLVARSATASFGGPELARVLGWDAKQNAVYVQIVHTGETESTPTLWRFDLGGGLPARPHYVDWSGGEEDDLYHQRLARLEKTLRPLHAEEAVGSMVQHGPESLAPYDSVESEQGMIARYLAPAGFGRSETEQVRVLTLDPGRSAVRLLRKYAIPGTSAKLLILSAEAEPMESGYEIQFPVIAGAPGTADPIDPRSFNVRR